MYKNYFPPTTCINKAQNVKSEGSIVITVSQLGFAVGRFC